mgnify:CR=1 FL=1
MKTEKENKTEVINETKDSVKVIYKDGKDYSHLEVNSHLYPEHEECVWCGETNVTITPDADICHDCGYVYT